MSKKLNSAIAAAGIAFSLTLPVQIAGVAMLYPSIAIAQDKKLPAPYISKALDATLIPINADVRKAFGLKKKQTGVLVLAVMPNGKADKNGIKAGDVISKVKNAKASGGSKSKGKKVKSPKKLDAAVKAMIKQGKTDFLFVGSSGGKKMSKSGSITAETFGTAI